MSEPESLSAAYDAIADAWRLSRTGDPFRERLLLERLLAPLPPKARILDLGCGCGEPIARFLSTWGFEVTGVDTSARLLTYARRAVPEANFLHGDMRTVRLEGRFDGIGGRLLLSLGGSGAAEITSEMFGAKFFYSGHEPEHARGLLRKAGFRIDHWEVDDPSSHGHIAVIAVRDAT